MSSQPHWRTPSFFKMGTLQHQPVNQSNFIISFNQQYQSLGIFFSKKHWEWNMFEDETMGMEWVDQKWDDWTPQNSLDRPKSNSFMI